MRSRKGNSPNVELPSKVYSFDVDAARKGFSPEEYAESLRNVAWPIADTRDCLSAEEVEQYCAKITLPMPRRKHLFSCQGCRALVSVSLPTEQHFEEFLEEVQRLTQIMTTGV